MFRSKLIIPALSFACLLASQAVVPTAMAASPLRAIVVGQPVAGVKMVHLNVANNTGSALELKVGETPVTVQVGETVQLTAPRGCKIIVAVASATRAAGSVLAEVSSELSGATIRVN